jgi:hypothetical protein
MLYKWYMSTSIIITTQNYRRCGYLLPILFYGAIYARQFENKKKLGFDMYIRRDRRIVLLTAGQKSFISCVPILITSLF